MDYKISQGGNVMKKVMIDTNIIISAVLFPNGQAAKALMKAILPPYEPIICSYVMEELHRKFAERFPDKRAAFDEFLNLMPVSIKLVETPAQEVEEEKKIRDPKDRPILRAALNEHADLFLTGDKDFLESSVEDPRIISVAAFLNE